jgi:hypothetical protein
MGLPSHYRLLPIVEVRASSPFVRPTGDIRLSRLRHRRPPPSAKPQTSVHDYRQRVCDAKRRNTRLAVRPTTGWSALVTMASAPSTAMFDRYSAPRPTENPNRRRRDQPWSIRAQDQSTRLYPRSPLWRAIAGCACSTAATRAPGIAKASSLTSGGNSVTINQSLISTSIAAQDAERLLVPAQPLHPYTPAPLRNTHATCGWRPSPSEDLIGTQRLQIRSTGCCARSS